MTKERPLWCQGLTFPARVDRQFIQDAFPFEGVLNGMAVSQHGAGDFTVDVAIGSCVMKGDDQANQGSYIGQIINSSERVTISAAPGSNSRIDLVVARVFDPDAGAGASPVFSVEAVTGVASGSPVAPAVPNTAIKLAEILVTSATTQILTANITDKRYFASDIQVATTTAQRDANPNATAGYNVYLNSGDANEGQWYYAGSAGMRLPWAMPWGIVPATAGGTNGKGYVRQTSNVDGGPASFDVGMSVTWNAYANRLYHVSAYNPSISLLTGSPTVAELCITGPSGEQNIIGTGPTHAPPGYSHYVGFLIYGVSGSITRKVQVNCDTGTVRANGASDSGTYKPWFMVQDVGPFGAPT